MKKKILWFSCGVTSAVACKIAIEQYGKENCLLAYIGIRSANDDNERFIRDCEKWYGANIDTFSSVKYKDQYEVIEDTKYVNGVAGARCTLELKKKVRQTIEENTDYDGQVFGFEFSKKEINRAVRFEQQYPHTKPIFPLIEKRLTKAECLGILEKVGIRKPKMYELGYHNNNCIGCVKGGKGYWNKIRVDFPDHFERMKKLEIMIGRSCIKDRFLKDLQPSEGRHEKEILSDCGAFCEIEFAHIIDKRTEEILNDFFKTEAGRQKKNRK